jgi:1-acyl-sn-glycerol-3-phosphate acyltransferase
MKNTATMPHHPPPRYPWYQLVVGRVWATWALILFLPTMCIAVVPIVFSFWLPEPFGIRLFKGAAKAWMTVFLYGVACPLRILGQQHYDKGKNYVVTSNHRSMMDVPLLTPFFPGPNKTIAKKSMARIPIFGWVYARGSVLVDRKSDASRRKSYDDMKAVLAQGLCMAIYPEGTRNRTPQALKPFYDGAFKLAVETGKPILPVVMYNTAKALPPSIPFFLMPTPLYMRLLPAIGSSGKPAEGLKQAVFDAMWQAVEEGPVLS